MSQLIPQMASLTNQVWVINHPREAIAHCPSNQGLFDAAGVEGYRAHWTSKREAQEKVNKIRSVTGIDVQLRNCQLDKDQIRQQKH